VRALLCPRPGELALVERVKRETTLLGSRNATREDFDVVFAMLRAGKIPTKALNTHRAALDDAPNMFAHWLRPSGGVVKALIEI